MLSARLTDWLGAAFSQRRAPTQGGDFKRGRWIVALLWLAFVAFLASRHVMWRDEVRALSLALGGDTIVDMPALARGYGHPLLWHCILRAGHDLFATRMVLPGAALLISVASATLLLWASPFRLVIVCLVLFSGFGLYEYGVIARNYGISMLLLFALAACYPHARRRGLLLGMLLALLCNTNVHSVVLAIAFYLFWAVDIAGLDGARWSTAKRVLLPNATLLALGALLSFASVFPSLEDAPTVATNSLLARGLQMIPGVAFARIFGNFHFGILLRIVAASLLVGSLGMFAKRPAALIAALAALLGMQAIFVFVYPGFYRPEALLIAFDITLLWLVLKGYGDSWPTHGGRSIWLARVDLGGRALFLTLRAAQLPASARAVINAVTARPESAARDIARLVSRYRLERAAIVADPDFMAETLPYYLNNPIYSLRQARFSHVVGMIRAESAPMTMRRILATAQLVHSKTGRDVLILLNTSLAVADHPIVIDRSTFGPLVLIPQEVRAFREGTVSLGEQRQASGDERFSVYLLNRAGRGAPDMTCIADASPPTPQVLRSPACRRDNAIARAPRQTPR